MPDPAADRRKGIAMAAIGVLVVVTALAAGLVGLLTVVIIGVHQEERGWTLGGQAPTVPARLARRVLGARYPVSRLDQLGRGDSGHRDDLFSDIFAGR